MKLSMRSMFCFAAMTGAGGWLHLTLGIALGHDHGQVRAASDLNPAPNIDATQSSSPKTIVSPVSAVHPSSQPAGLFISSLSQAHAPRFASSSIGSTRLAQETILSPSDKDYRFAQPSQESYVSTRAVQEPNVTKKSISQLLDVQTMIGPMNDVSSTLSRAEQKTKWNEETRIIPNGARMVSPELAASPTAYTWASPVFHHRPLYFEQPNLERYGNGPCRIAQPVASSAHFLLSVPLMPFKMIYNPPWSDIHTLGEGRPGDAVRSHSLHDVMFEE
ncbi:MAG: hypothetical protein MUC43_14390 [Pirellula sp.]|jgi:hypothetical protein|nr:hypothetical protein [Pirellula sp.]